MLWLNGHDETLEAFLKSQNYGGNAEWKQSFELFSSSCRLIKEEEVKKWKEHADKMRKGNFSLWAPEIGPAKGYIQQITTDHLQKI